MDVLLASAIVPTVALLAWFCGLARGPSGSARFRYRVSLGLVVYGIASIVITITAIFAGLELGFITWGGPDNFWIAAATLSGLLSIATGGVMAVANIALLRLTRSDSSHKGIR